MGSPEPFVLFDCGLARLALGQSCSNLRELLVAVRTVPDPVIEHHMMRCVLEDHFEMHEFPNDLARWCWDSLGDRVLAEQLGLVDPYHHASIASLRESLVDAIEERLWGLDRVPWCRPGLELHLVQSRLVTHDTGERFSALAEMAEALPRISRRSLFYHVHEARRRTGGATDDFSVWLEKYEIYPELVAALRAIDFYFLNLQQLRQEFIEVCRRFMPESPLSAGVTT
jgi:hypothetical protein